MQRKATMAALMGSCLLPLTASAHVLPGEAGLVHGLLHPLTGLDHILAMVAVGLWAAQVGGRAVWAVPTAFVSAMSFGAALGMSGAQLPGIEAGITTSVLVFGIVITMALRVPVWSGMALVSAFAIFHGYAHGTEMVVGMSAATFGLGFIASTVLLHVVGIGIGLALSRTRGAFVVRFAGASIATCGLLMCAGMMR